MALNDEGKLIGGTYTYGNIPDVYFKYDMDKIGKLIVISRYNTKWLQYLQHKVGLKANRVNSFSPRNQSIDALPRFIQVYESSATTLAANTKLKVLNKYGQASVRQNDILTVGEVFFEPNNTTQYSTTFGSAANEYYVKNELLFVTGVDPNDAAGTGYTYIYVRRGWSSNYTFPSYSNSTAALNAAPSSPPPILTNYKLHKSGNAFAHGTGAPTGSFANPSVDGNYLQEMKWAITIVQEMELEKTWLVESGVTPLSLQERLKAAEMMHQYECWLLHSQKTFSQDSIGNPIFTSMGMLPYIKCDSEHLIDYTRGGKVQTVNYMDINTICNDIFALGGGEQKTMLFGNTSLTLLQNAFWNKFMFTSEEITKEFHIPVFKLQSAAGELEILATVGMDELGWTDRALIWDFSVPSIDKNVFNGETKLGSGKTVIADFDMYVEDHIELPGERVHKKAYTTISGFQLRAQQYHGILYNIPSAVARYTTDTAL